METTCPVTSQQVGPPGIAPKSLIPGPLACGWACFSKSGSISSSLWEGLREDVGAHKEEEILLAPQPLPRMPLVVLTLLGRQRQPHNWE